MMRKKIILISVLSCLYIFSFGQNSYYSINNTINFGATVIEGDEITNSKYCQIKINDQVVRYTPYEASGYGFMNGTEYVSKEIIISDTIARVFLQKLFKGSINLYYYHGPSSKRYFIEKDSSGLTELLKDSIPGISNEYRTTISNYATDCKTPTEVIDALKYSKKSLKRFFKQYEYCEFKKVKYVKYGIIVGYSSLRLKYADAIRNEPLKNMDYYADKGFVFGLYYDQPISTSDFSIYSELYLSKHGFSFNNRNNFQDVDFVVNTTSLILPVTLKYSIPLNKIKPFANLGVNFLYNVKNENTYYEATISENLIELKNYKRTSFISDFLMGFSIGGGIEYMLTTKNSFFLGIRISSYQDYFNIKKYKSSELILNTGISF
jgi:hypothetical protein